MKPLIKTNTTVENIVTYLQLELGKIASNNDTLCFTTTTEVQVTVVNKSNAKELQNHSKLTIANPITIPKGTKLFIPLAELPHKQIDTDLTIQYALSEDGKCLHFIRKSPFGFSVRHLTISLLGGNHIVQSNQPKVSKVRQSEKQLAVALKWYEEQQTLLGLNSIKDVTKHYKTTRQWQLASYWHEWSKIDSELFPETKFDRNFFSKHLNRHINSLKE